MHSSVRDWKDSLKNLVIPTRTEREDQYESNIFDMLITSSIEICDTVWNCDPNSHATFMSHRTYHFARPFAFHAVNLCRVVSYLSSRPWNNAWYFLTFSFPFFLFSFFFFDSQNFWTQGSWEIFPSIGSKWKGNHGFRRMRKRVKIVHRPSKQFSRQTRV